MSLPENCRIRPGSADVDFPKSGSFSTLTGGLRFVVFNALNMSNRNCTSAPEPLNHPTRTDLINERSTLKYRGPRYVLRPRVPWTPGAGVGKSDALKIPLRKSSLLRPESDDPNEGVFGRSLPVPSAL